MKKHFVIGYIITNMKTVYIYSLTDPRTSEIRYIGKTVTPTKRFQRHIRNARNSTHKYHSSVWINSLLSNGVKPLFSVIEVCDENNWQERERYWIEHYRGIFDLTNICDGGVGNVSYGFLGKKHSSESIEKMRKARIGVSIKQNDKNGKRRMSLRATLDRKKVPVVQYNLDGSHIREWDSAVDAGNYLGIRYSDISSVCKGKNRRTCGGFIWKFKNERQVENE